MTTTDVPFAVSLTLEKDEEPATRLAKLVATIRRNALQWKIREIDATGALGNSLTQAVNEGRTSVLTQAEFLGLLCEDGQVFELQADGVVDAGRLFTRVLISDGRYVDWMGFGDPTEVAAIGEHKLQPCELFNWPEKDT
jgi:hypothetical protein